MKIAIYPGTFDPITSGHLDLIIRSLKFVDKLYVAIAADSTKATLFSVDERMALIKEELISNNITNAEVSVFSGLMVDYAAKNSASIVIRGLRAVSDFEYEFQMHAVNSLLNGNIQTIFLPAMPKLQLASSKIVKEIVKLGGDAGELVSANVLQKLHDKYNNPK